MRPWSKQNRFIVSYAFLSLLIMPLVCVRERETAENLKWKSKAWISLSWSPSLNHNNNAYFLPRNGTQLK